jgi:DNA-binding IclR family transcriptional regulator
VAIKRKTFGGEGVAAVNRALTVVIALEAAGEAISLAELSRQTGLYKSTLLRLIASLEQFALVAVRPDKKYCLGPLAFRLGRAFEATDHLQDQVVPALESLVEQGTESASFHVRHDHKQRLCLFRVDSKHSTLDRVKAGDLLPMDRGAAGKAIRTFEQQLSDEDLIKNEIVVESFGERNPNIAGIAAPVFGGEKHFYGVICLSGPFERFTDSNTRKMKRLLIGECREVTALLGGKWPWS